MRSIYRAVHALLCTAFIACSILPAQAATQVPLDYRAYDGWSDVRGQTLSDDGASLAYVVTPEDADPTLIVRTLANGRERSQIRGSAPVFVDGGRFVLFTHLAPRKAIDEAKNAGKPPAEQPKSGLGILDLRGSAATDIIDTVKTYVYPRDGGSTIAYLAEPSPSPSPLPSASPSASPKPKTADKTKAPGSMLTIRNLEGKTRSTIANVSDVVEARNGAFIAYATQSAAGTHDGVHVYAVANGATYDVLSGAGRYRNLAIARDGSSLAFLSDVATYARDVPHDSLYVVHLRAAPMTATRAVESANANGTVSFSRDGQRVFFGTAAMPTPMASASPHPVKVDIWAWNDAVLQSQQRHDAETDRKHTNLALYDMDAHRFVQLASPSMRIVQINENPKYALGLDDRAYRRAVSWLGEEYFDMYAVRLADGRRRLLARHVSTPSLSPGGSYALAWSEPLQHWVVYRTGDGSRVVLGAQARTRFSLENDDHPEPPQSYGQGGWLAGDRAVLLYDRYDVWRADPSTGRVADLTAARGRRTHTVYSPVQPDTQADAFDPRKPILLSLIDERTLASGYAQVDSGGGVPHTLLRTNELVNGVREPFAGGLHDLGLAPVAAQHAPVYAFSRETFRYRELWTSDASFGHLQQATNLHPQQARYRWGSERLIHYRASDGTPLRAVMLVPDALSRTKRAPMLVYFYETWSSLYHSYYAPGPGTSPNLSRYVSNGYVVLLPDVRYRVGHPGKSAVNCLLPAVDAAIKTGYVNPARVGIAGHSWAAYQINYLLTQTHRFRAAEAGAAVDDMISAYSGIRLESGVARESQYEHGQSRIGATPWDRPDLYIENSGLFGIKRITTPYLTVHNDGDTAVPQFQGIEFITAMRRLGKVAYLLSFDGEKHGIVERENQKYWTVHLDEWFDHYLKGAPRPKWFDGVPFLRRGERNVDALFGD
ncbi:MAG: prolyl oligopeptidase family serine peptidase [Candidatus Eremiobacteraeota bacterium]|nr:prolyl oligopeptidase family serine peptidase [Candidatus Eremiobacteraeota bacterium]